MAQHVCVDGLFLHPRYFGTGVHTCVGLAVARLEGRVAIERFLARFPGYRLVGRQVRGGRARFRGFLSVPVAFGA